MIKTILIEDESYIRKGLITLINSLNKNLDIIAECSSVKEAITVVTACKPELIFLDINLPDGNAFDFLEKTKTVSYKVIFITAYEEYALRALKNGAIDYILKPVDIEELEIAIDKALKTENFKENQIQYTKEQLSKDKLILSLQDGFQCILFDDLIYCKSDGGYTTFYLSDGRSFMASKSIKEFENQLPESNFVRTHQSYIVNMAYVDKYDKTGYLYLKNRERIPVSTRKKDIVISLIAIQFEEITAFKIPNLFFALLKDL
jgi:two-component system LytT family response regulator